MANMPTRFPHALSFRDCSSLGMWPWSAVDVCDGLSEKKLSGGGITGHEQYLRRAFLSLLPESPQSYIFSLLLSS
jgi:hypothetical protein